MTSALLFDLDGTLVDTDHIHLAAFQSVFAPYGVSLDRARYNAEILGASNAWIGERFLPQLDAEARARVLDAKEAAYRAGVGPVEPVAGLIELLDFSDERRLRRAVVTNAPRANAELILAALGLASRLPLVICGAELARGKPDPLPYLIGLEETGAEARRAVAFEDSLSGVRAAAAAGIAVVGLKTSLTESRLLEAGALIAVDDFRDARVYQLIEQRIAA
jgi:beta-phosphoglucomutase-like phosphatase (HAD superfamily)